MFQNKLWLLLSLAFLSVDTISTWTYTSVNQVSPATALMSGCTQWRLMSVGGEYQGLVVVYSQCAATCPNYCYITATQLWSTDPTTGALVSVVGTLQIQSTFTTGTVANPITQILTPTANATTFYVYEWYGTVASNVQGVYVYQVNLNSTYGFVSSSLVKTLSVISTQQMNWVFDFYHSYMHIITYRTSTSSYTYRKYDILDLANPVLVSTPVKGFNGGTLVPAVWDMSAMFYYRGSIYFNDDIVTGAGSSNALSGNNIEQWSTTTSSFTFIQSQTVGAFERGICAGFGMVISGGGSTSIVRIYNLTTFAYINTITPGSGLTGNYHCRFFGGVGTGISTIWLWLMPAGGSGNIFVDVTNPLSPVVQATTSSIWNEVILSPITITSKGFYYLGSNSNLIKAGKLANTGFALNETILKGLMYTNTIINPLALTINSGFSGFTPAVVSSSMLMTIDTDADYSALFNITYTITSYGGGSCVIVYKYNFITSSWVALNVGSTFNQVDININSIMINATTPYCANGFFTFTVSNSRGGYVSSTTFSTSNLFATYDPFLYSPGNVTTATSTGPITNPLLLTTLTGHTRGVNSVFVYNAWIFTASDDFKIRQILNTDYSLIRVFPTSGQGHTQAVTHAIYDGTSYLWSTGLDAQLIKWDCFTGIAIGIYTNSFTNYFYGLWVTSSSVFIGGYSHYSGAPYNSLVQFNSATGARVREFNEPALQVSAVTVVGNNLYSADNDFALRQWNIATGALVSTLVGHTGIVTCLYADSTYLFSGSTDMTIKQWDVTSGAVKRTYTGHTNSVNGIFVYKDSLFSGSTDKLAGQWNITSGQFVRFYWGHIASINCVGVYSNLLYTASSDYTTKIWLVPELAIVNITIPVAPVAVPTSTRNPTASITPIAQFPTTVAPSTSAQTALSSSSANSGILTIALIAFGAVLLIGMSAAVYVRLQHKIDTAKNNISPFVMPLSQTGNTTITSMDSTISSSVLPSQNLMGAYSTGMQAPSINSTQTQSSYMMPMPYVGFPSNMPFENDKKDSFNPAFSGMNNWGPQSGWSISNSVISGTQQNVGNGTEIKEAVNLQTATSIETAIVDDSPDKLGTLTMSMNGATTTVSQNGPSYVMSIPGHLQVGVMDYRLNGKIAQGGAGEIFQAQTVSNDSALHERLGDRKFVVKRMKEAGKEAFIQEVSIMALFVSHENFATLVGFNDEELDLMILFYPIGSLHNWIRNKDPHTVQVVHQLIFGCSNALTALHACGIVHFDIKPANILIDQKSDGTLVPKLTDFGVSNIVEQTTLQVGAFKVQNVRGLSVAYSAPERFSKTIPLSYQWIKIAKSADIYSLAIVIIEILNKDHPWKKSG